MTRRVLLPFFVALVAWGWFNPGVVHASGPCGSATLDELYESIQGTETSVNNAYGSPDSQYATLTKDVDAPYLTGWSFNFDQTLQGTITLTPTFTNNGITNANVYINPNQDVTANGGPGWVFAGTLSSPEPYTGTAKAIHIQVQGPNAAYIDLDSIEFDATDCELVCPLVPNADMSTDSDWSLTGSAVITGGVLSMPPNSTATQNLALASNSEYLAVIDVSGVVSSTSLAVQLGSQTEYLNVSSSGFYQVNLTTSDLAGPVTYGFQNLIPNIGTVEIDYTCLSLASSGPGGEQTACVAPTNGEFASSSGWDFFRGASWQHLSQDVSLPSNGDETNSGLVLTSNTFDLPDVVTSTPYLLLSFDAKSINDDGLVGANVDATSDFTGYFQTYTIYYTYESDITDLAGETATLAFANVPTDTLDASVTVDNACIFLSDRPPMLPYPTDPDSIDPVQIGFGFTSCEDVDGIWSWLGVNMAQYRSDYAAGFSIWDDPLQWVVAAVFVTLGDWSCFFMLGLASMLNLLEYILNNILNIFNWFRLGLPGIINWGNGWAEFFGDSLSNLSTSYGDFLGDWANWIGSSLTNVSDWTGGYLSARSDWIGSSLTNLSSWIGNTLTAWADWIGTSLTNIAAWFSDAAVQNVIGALFLFSLLLNFFSFIWAILTWIWVNFIIAAQIPIIMFESFNSGVQSAGFSGFVNCSSNNLWCFLLAGVEIVNQSVGPTILYPFMIVAIIIGTIIILRDRIPDLYNFVLETIRGL